jgi:hypothetical protein
MTDDRQDKVFLSLVTCHLSPVTVLMATRFMDRLIEVGTKALRRGPVSGETLLAPRRQLQRFRASPFDLARQLKSNLKFLILHSVVSDGPGSSTHA